MIDNLITKIYASLNNLNYEKVKFFVIKLFNFFKIIIGTINSLIIFLFSKFSIFIPYRDYTKMSNDLIKLKSLTFPIENLEANGTEVFEDIYKYLFQFLHNFIFAPIFFIKIFEKFLMYLLSFFIISLSIKRKVNFILEIFFKFLYSVIYIIMSIPIIFFIFFMLYFVNQNYIIGSFNFICIIKDIFFFFIPEAYIFQIVEAINSFFKPYFLYFHKSYSTLGHLLLNNIFLENEKKDDFFNSGLSFGVYNPSNILDMFNTFVYHTYDASLKELKALGYNDVFYISNKFKYFILKLQHFGGFFIFIEKPFNKFLFVKFLPQMPIYYLYFFLFAFFIFIVNASKNLFILVLNFKNIENKYNFVVMLMIQIFIFFVSFFLIFLFFYFYNNNFLISYYKNLSFFVGSDERMVFFSIYEKLLENFISNESKKEFKNIIEEYSYTHQIFSNFANFREDYRYVIIHIFKMGLGLNKTSYHSFLFNTSINSIAGEEYYDPHKMFFSLKNFGIIPFSYGSNIISLYYEFSLRMHFAQNLNILYIIYLNSITTFFSLLLLIYKKIFFIFFNVLFFKGSFFLIIFIFLCIIFIYEKTYCIAFLYFFMFLIFLYNIYFFLEIFKIKSFISFTFFLKYLLKRFFRVFLIFILVLYLVLYIIFFMFLKPYYKIIKDFIKDIIDNFFCIDVDDSFYYCGIYVGQECAKILRIAEKFQQKVPELSFFTGIYKAERETYLNVSFIDKINYILESDNNFFYFLFSSEILISFFIFFSLLILCLLKKYSFFNKGLTNIFCNICLIFISIIIIFLMFNIFFLFEKSPIYCDITTNRIRKDDYYDYTYSRYFSSYLNKYFIEDFPNRFFLFQYTENFFNKHFIVNLKTQYFKLLISFCILIFLFFSKNFAFNEKSFSFYEFYILIMLSLLGIFLFISSSSLISLYLSLELVSLTFYILAASKRYSIFSTEASLKYFILSSLASCLILYGMSLVYGFSGLIFFEDLKIYVFSSISYFDLNLGFILGLLLIVIGFLFKIGAAPFHAWVPDVYEGVPLPVTLFFATIPKIFLAFFFLNFINNIIFLDFTDVLFLKPFKFIFLLTGLLSFFIGSFGALYQSKIKRLFAYSAISNVGFFCFSFFLCMFLNKNVNIIFGIFFFLLSYVCLSFLIFFLILNLRRFNNNIEIKHILDLENLFKVNPSLSIIFSLSFFSLAGIPPLLGFFGKFFILLPLIENNFYIIALFILIFSVISSFYYIRIIKIIFFSKKNNWIFIKPITRSSSFILIFLTFFNIFFIINPSFFLEFVYKIALIFCL